MKKYKTKIIAVDFDGTMAHKSWPSVSTAKVNKPLVKWLLHRKHMGDKVIIWTCRENYGGKYYEDHTYLDDAVEFCSKNGLTFDNINRNYEESNNELSMYSRKIFADFYIDDKSIPFNMGGKLSFFKWKLYLFIVGIHLK